MPFSRFVDLNRCGFQVTEPQQQQRSARNPCLRSFKASTAPQSSLLSSSADGISLEDLHIAQISYVREAR